MIKLSRLALSFLAVAALVPAATHAQVVTPQPPPTIITSAPYTISAPGYYQLGADLFYAGSGAAGDAIITINSGNVTLDFAGHYISGPTNSPSSQLVGVYTYERGNINIRNGTIAYCATGVDLEGNGQSNSVNINQRVDNMLITYCTARGVAFPHATNSIVSNCRISFTGNDTAFGNAYGIYAYSGFGNQVLNNTITNVTGTDSAAAYGVYGAGSLTVTGNAITNVISNATSAAYGVYICGFADHNKIYACYYGLYSATLYSDNLALSCNTAFANGTAVGNGNGGN